MSNDQLEGVLKKGVGRVQDALGGIVGDSKMQVDGKVKQAAGSVQGAYGQARDTVEDAASHLSDHAEGAYREAERFVRDQPLLTLVAAVAGGLVAGLLLRGPVYTRR